MFQRIFISSSEGGSWFNYEMQCLGQMEAHAALAGSQPQFSSHDVARRIFGNFQVVDAGHHRRQILVGILISIDLLAHDGQRWCQGFEAASRQTRCSSYELQEQSLLLTVVLAENVVERLNGRRILRETVVSAAAVGQHSDVPLLVV